MLNRETPHCSESRTINNIVYNVLVCWFGGQACLTFPLLKGACLARTSALHRTHLLFFANHIYIFLRNVYDLEVADIILNICSAQKGRDCNCFCHGPLKPQLFLSCAVIHVSHSCLLQASWNAQTAITSEPAKANSSAPATCTLLLWL